MRPVEKYGFIIIKLLHDNTLMLLASQNCNFTKTVPPCKIISTTLRSQAERSTQQTLLGSQHQTHTYVLSRQKFALNQQITISRAVKLK